MATQKSPFISLREQFEAAKKNALEYPGHNWRSMNYPCFDELSFLSAWLLAYQAEYPSLDEHNQFALDQLCRMVAWAWSTRSLNNAHTVLKRGLGIWVLQDKIAPHFITALIAVTQLVLGNQGNARIMMNLPMFTETKASWQRKKPQVLSDDALGAVLGQRLNLKRPD